MRNRYRHVLAAGAVLSTLGVATLASCADNTGVTLGNPNARTTVDKSGSRTTNSCGSSTAMCGSVNGTSGTSSSTTTSFTSFTSSSTTSTSGSSASSAGTASPSPSASPVATSVAISPASLTLYVPPAPGSTLPPATYATSASLSAKVAMSDGNSTTSVTWELTGPNAGIATLDASGSLSIVTSGSGTGPWTLTVKAVSADGDATGSENVTVEAVGDAAVSVQ